MASPLRIGPFDVIRPLGGGGSATLVLACRRSERAHIAAVKLFPDPRLVPAAADAFDIERETLSRLDHPRIVRLLEAGITDDARPWLAIEHFDGEPIDGACDRQQLDLEARLRLFIAVARTVDAAHRQLVVHGDLKPANILVRADGEHRLLDFGSARIAVDASAGATAAAANESASAMTAAWSSPERRRGARATVAGDVYSLGLLIARLADIPERQRRASDLAAILAMALAEDPVRRYASVADFADDVSACLDHRPLRARRDSLLRKLRRRVRRHPVLVPSLAVGVVVAASFAAIALRQLRAERRSMELARSSEELLPPFRDQQRIADLEFELAGIWPAHPRMVPALERWLEEAAALARNATAHAAELARVEATATTSAADGDSTPQTLALRRTSLESVLAAFARFAHPDPALGAIAACRARIEQARRVEADSILAHATEWEAAIADLAARDDLHGVPLAPQVGLVPLGRDRWSGLHEFWCIETGARPGRAADGETWRVGEETGVVLVLIPGGTATIGSPPDEPFLANGEPLRHAVELPPYFLAKHELTQGQWLRIAGTTTNPSLFSPAAADPDPASGHGPFTLAHPVESISQLDCRPILVRAGLRLPSGDEWEHGVRGGTHTRWSTGDDADLLFTQGVANLADRSLLRAGIVIPALAESGPHDDGWPFHAPVGSFVPNAFGLHDMHGNVLEWCADQEAVTMPPIVAGDPPRKSLALTRWRGGSFTSPPQHARCAWADNPQPNVRSPAVGVRPARSLDP